MISDMDLTCPKCGGILERKSIVLHSSSAREYICQCTQCGDETIVTYESTSRDIDDSNIPD